MRASALTLLLCLTAGAGFALDEPRGPSLFARGDDRGWTQPLRISEYHADVLIAGAAASTTLTLVFQNESHRRIEGRLVLPVGEGKTVSRFAMDVNGKIREGVVVERGKARRVFEAIVARRVDPGLLSWVDGSRYEARVFPIPARGTKTIVVRYEEVLRDRGGGHAQYRLPVDLGVTFDHFRARVRFADPETEISAWNTHLLEFPEEGESLGTAEIDERNYLPERYLSVGFRAGSRTVVAAPREGGGRHFFALPRLAQRRVARPDAPKRVGLMWDNSGSAARRNTGREIGFLDAYFRSLGDAEVELQVFGFGAEPVEKFAVEGGEWRALRDRLEALRPDGATDFGAPEWTWTDVDLVLLFSDGVATLGGEEVGALPVPLYPVVSGEISVGESLLERVAAESGGGVVSLGGAVERALESLGAPPGRLLGVAGSGGEGVTQLFPDGPCFGQRPLVAGVVKGDAAATVELRYGAAGSEAEPLRLEIPAAPEEGEPDPELASLAYQMWVRAKLESLEDRRRTRWREIAELSIEAGLVTPDSSLLVLDFISDYVNNRIPPPESEPELVADYNARVGDRREEALPPEQQFVAVRKQFNRWYAQEFPWLAESNLRVAENGHGFVRRLVREHPDRDDFKRDLQQLGPIRERAKASQAEHEKLADERDARRAWLVEAMGLKAELEPLQAKYGEVYRERVAAVRKVIDLYDIDTAAEQRGLFLRGDAADDDPFGDLGDGFSADDPFSTGASSGGGGGRSRGGRELQVGAPLAAAIQSDARWQADAPHLESLKAAKDEAEFVERYFERRATLGRDPLFYVDAGDLAAERGFVALAVRIFSNLAELKLDDVRLLRMLAYRLDTHGQHEAALGIYRHVYQLVPEDGLAQRDLGLGLARCGDRQAAFDRLWGIVSTPEHPALNAIVFLDLQQLVAADAGKELVLPKGASGLRNPRERDLRVVATWDTDAVEIDLLIVEPGNGVASSDGPATLTGGQLGGATGGGFGPEHYLIKRALPGVYQLKARVAPGRKRGTLPAPSTVYLDITKGFGSAGAERRRLAIRVGRGETDLATVKFSADEVAK